MAKEKTYLAKREFVNKGDKNDKTVATATVRRFDWGGYSADLEITSPQSFGSSGGIYISCSPDNAESVEAAMTKIDSFIACMTQYKEAVQQAAKDAAKDAKDAAKKASGNSPVKY